MAFVRFDDVGLQPSGGRHLLDGQFESVEVGQQRRQLRQVEGVGEWNRRTCRLAGTRSES